MTTEQERQYLQLVQRGLDALAAGDVPAFIDHLHPEATWHVAPAGTLKGHYRGRDQIAGFFAHASAETDDTFRIRPHALAAAGDRVFVLHSATASRNGVRNEWHSVLVFTVNDGLATSVHHYTIDHPSLERFWS